MNFLSEIINYFVELFGDISIFIIGFVLYMSWFAAGALTLWNFAMGNSCFISFCVFVFLSTIVFGNSIFGAGYSGPNNRHRR